MDLFICKMRNFLTKKFDGMEMVQVAILIAIVVVLGLIFKTQLTNFVNGVFKDLMKADF